MIFHTKQGKDIIVGDFIWNSLTYRFFLVLQIQAKPDPNAKKVMIYFLTPDGKVESGLIAISINYNLIQPNKANKNDNTIIK